MRTMQHNTPPQTDWHLLDAGEALARQRSDGARGLSATEAQARLDRYGPNELVERGRNSPFAILLEQITEPMVLILLIAASVSLLLGEVKSVIAILAIVILNAILGVVQEYRAEKAMAALKQMAAPTVRVRRDGEPAAVDARTSSLAMSFCWKRAISCPPMPD